MAWPPIFTWRDGDLVDALVHLAGAAEDRVDALRVEVAAGGSTSLDGTGPGC
jgi:hypothetical protein